MSKSMKKKKKKKKKKRKEKKNLTEILLIHVSVCEFTIIIIPWLRHRN